MNEEDVEATRAILLKRISPIMPFLELWVAVLYAVHSPMDALSVDPESGRTRDPPLFVEVAVSFAPSMNREVPLESLTKAMYIH